MANTLVEQLDKELRKGDLTTCRHIIANGIEVRSSDGDGALHIAAEAGNLEAVRLLLGAGAPVDGRNDNGETPLHIAAFFGQLDICRLHVDSGATVNAVGNNDATPLHDAANGGDAGVCEYLISVGAQTEAVNLEEDTPLNRAVANNYLACCRVLVAAGASSSFVPERLTTGQYTTPFQTSVWLGKLEIARYFLLECNEDLTQKTKSGRTLDEICRQSELQAFRSLKTEVEVARAVSDAIPSGHAPRRTAGMCSL